MGQPAEIVYLLDDRIVFVLSNRSTVVESPDGDIIECIHTRDQPSFNHPLLWRKDWFPTRPEQRKESLEDTRQVSKIRLLQIKDVEQHVFLLWGI
ncbi:hypothetical protein AXX17_AT3G48520 [Arabidopsis thaliana]|uniref:Neprosin activation peptide domain-containing protein n=1 Tax=Arabidopsis thaliana TaxID=3702 RepID=A0A178VBA2_ARATH|nr:hypothetical protein AXX17_AT3G48520 [Arabidopsis thaliana]